MDSFTMRRIREVAAVASFSQRHDKGTCLINQHHKSIESSISEQSFVWGMFESARLDRDNHFANLDHMLSTFVIVDADLRQPNVEGATSILLRLPEAPYSTVVYEDPSSTTPWTAQWSTCYEISATAGLDSADISHPESTYDPLKAQVERSRFLQVVHILDTNTILNAFKICAFGGAVGDNHEITKSIDIAKDLSSYLDTLADLLETAVATNLEATASGVADPASPTDLLLNNWVEEVLGITGWVDSKEAAQARDVVIQFLWTSWQRSLMMLQYHNLISGMLEMSPAPQGITPRETFMKNVMTVDRVEMRKMPGYICPWALKLVQNGHNLVVRDIRKLVERFEEQFGDREGRCFPGEQKTCYGQAAEHCGRFFSMPPPQQHFAHGKDCNGENCFLIPWNRKSYLLAASPRAVSIANGSTVTELHYCHANSQTLAISHVWSHGQGGRPQQGIHACLHHRYCSIAHKRGCESYWIDTTCITEEEDLRNEAIAGINSVFSNSKVTLVCDKDLMSSDMKDIDDPVAWERLMATLFVCDWNVRCWTLLEGLKGNRNLHFLAKNDQAVRFMDGVEILLRESSIDFVLLLSTTSHLIPITNLRRQRSLSFEEAGHMLSHRMASREGDDIIIWSLLSIGKRCKTIEDLVKTVVKIRTGFLFSSSPRSTTIGFRWAPKTSRLCDVSPSYDRTGPWSMQEDDQVCDSSSGEGSMVGQVTAYGLQAKWHMLLLDITSADVLWDYLQEDIWDAGHPTWARAFTFLKRHRKVAFLKPIAADGWVTANVGQKVAVCTSDDGIYWKWEKVLWEPASIHFDKDEDAFSRGIRRGDHVIRWTETEIVLN